MSPSRPPRRSHRRGRQRIDPRALAGCLTLSVIAMQVALLAAFWLYPDDPPASGTLWQALWARANMPSFYPLLALAIAGPPATYLALSVRGRHRRPLLAAWVAFLPLLVTLHGPRVLIMLEILWKFA